MKPDIFLAECITLVEQKTGLLGRVLEVTSRQQEFLDAEEYTTRLMDNLEERQNLIDEINAVDKKLEEYLPYPHDARLLALADEQRSLIVEIAKQDESNERAARAHIEALKEKLRKLQEGKRGIEGYDPAPFEQGANYIDKKN